MRNLFCEQDCFDFIADILMVAVMFAAQNLVNDFEHFQEVKFSYVFVS